MIKGKHKFWDLKSPLLFAPAAVFSHGAFSHRRNNLIYLSIFLLALILTGCGKKSLSPEESLSLAVNNTCSYLLDGRDYNSLRLTGFAEGLSFDCCVAPGEQEDGTVYIDGAFGYDVVRNLSVSACITPKEAEFNIPLLSKNSFVYRFGSTPKGLITEYISEDYIKDFDRYFKLAVDTDIFGLLKAFKEGRGILDLEEPVAPSDGWEDGTLCYSFNMKVLPGDGELIDLKEQTGDFRVFVKDNHLLKLEMYNIDGRRLLSLDFPKEDREAGGSPALRLITWYDGNITSDIDIEISDKMPEYKKTGALIDVFSITEDIFNEIKKNAEEEYVFYF